MSFKDYLNEQEVKNGDTYNYKGISWKVIKAGKTESKSIALTKSKEGEEAMHDNKIIKKVNESLNEKTLQAGDLKVGTITMPDGEIGIGIKVKDGDTVGFDKSSFNSLMSDLKKLGNKITK